MGGMIACMKTCSLRDSRGKGSKTLFFVTVAWAVLMIKFILGGWWDFPVISAGDFGMACAAVLAPWIGREWKDKSLPSDLPRPPEKLP